MELRHRRASKERTSPSRESAPPVRRQAPPTKPLLARLLATGEKALLVLLVVCLTGFLANLALKKFVDEPRCAATPNLRRLPLKPNDRGEPQSALVYCTSSAAASPLNYLILNGGGSFFF